MAAAIRFYLDENMPVDVAEQLRRRGIDAVTVRDLGLLGESDINHLHHAIAEGRVRDAAPASGPRADIVRGAIEACRLEAHEPAGVRLGGGGDAV